MGQKIEHIWSVICQRAITDENTKLLSIIDVFEKLTIEGKPAIPDNDGKVIIPVSFSVVTFWRNLSENNQDETKVYLEIIDPNNLSIGKNDFSFIPEIGKPFHRTISVFNGLPIKNEGIYLLKMSKGEGKKKTQLIKIPFIVEFKTN